MYDLIQRLLKDFEIWKNLENIDEEYLHDYERINEKYFETDYFKEEFSEQEQKLLTSKANLTIPVVSESLWCVLIEKSGNIVDSYKNEDEAIERCNNLNNDFNVKVLVKKYISE